MYNKKYIAAEQTFNIQERFQCFYEKIIPVHVILIDSVHREGKNY